MGNSPSAPEKDTINSINIIKTDGDQVSGISLVYNKEDEDKILTRIQKTLETRTEAFDFDEFKQVDEPEPIKDLRSILEQDSELEEQEEEKKEEKKEEKEEEKEDVKDLMKKIEDILAEKTETKNL
jgi:excinuclease UvrABC helicase subunit UvrB